MRTFHRTVAAGVLAAGLVSAVTATSASAATRPSLSTWAARANPVFKSMSVDLSAIGTATGQSNTTNLKAACTALAKDTKKARKKTLPAPSKKIQNQLAAALKYYAAGSTNCVKAIDASDTSRLQTAAAQPNKANGYANKMRQLVTAAAA